MDKDRKHIESLIEKYLDGDTSNSEEQLLRRYFANRDNDIPDEWKALRALFGYEEHCLRKRDGCPDTFYDGGRHRTGG